MIETNERDRMLDFTLTDPSDVFWVIGERRKETAQGMIDSVGHAFQMPSKRFNSANTDAHSGDIIH